MSPLTPAEAAEIGSELETKAPNDLAAFVGRSAKTTDPLRKTLALFALALSYAKRARLAGRIGEALKGEAEAERYYEALPPEARW